MKTLFKALAGLFAAFVVLIVILAITVGGNTDKTKVDTPAAPTQSQSQAPAPDAPNATKNETAPTAPAPPVAPKKDTPNDVVTVKLDDQSVVSEFGTVDLVYADFSITNHSSKASDYTIDYQVLNNGVRVDSGTAYVTNVEPGQTAKDQEILIQTKHADVKAGATVETTSVDRSADSSSY